MSNRRRTYGNGDGKLGIYAEVSYTSRAYLGDNLLGNNLMYSDDGMRNLKIGCKLPIPSDEVYGDIDSIFYMNPAEDGYIYCVGKYPVESVSYPLPDSAVTKIVIYKVNLSGCDYTDTSVTPPYEVVYESSNSSDYYFQYSLRSYIVGDIIYMYSAYGGIYGSYNIGTGSFTRLYASSIGTEIYHEATVGDNLVLLENDSNSIYLYVISSDQDLLGRKIHLMSKGDSISSEYAFICNDAIMITMMYESYYSLKIYSNVEEHILNKESKWKSSDIRGYSSDELLTDYSSSGSRHIIPSSNYRFQTKESNKVLAMIEQDTYSEYPTWIINESDFSKTLLNTCNSMFTQFRSSWSINELDEFYLINGNGWGYAVTYDEFKTSQVVGLDHDTYTDTNQIINRRSMMGIIRL